MNIVSLDQQFGTNRVRRNVFLAPFTTFRIGGRADFLLEVTSEAELADAVRQAREADVEWFLMGLGANILVGDNGFRGLVILNRATSFEIDTDEERLITSSGAVVWPDIVKSCVSAGYSGFEHFAGIPSTIGGGLWQNLHFLSPDRSRTVFIEEIFESARVVSTDGSISTRDAKYFEFGYDTSVLHRSGDIVLSAQFRLQPQSVSVLEDIVRSNLEWRAERHPPLETEPSAGSIFKKIEGIGAGRLIDGCGLKGTRIGGAEITSRHANIIINSGGASASDVCGLISLVQETVLRETGHALETEIRMIGEFV